jgi:hypothetical protein
MTVGVPERGLRSRADRDGVHVGAGVGEILQLVDEVLDLLRIHVSHLSNSFSLIIYRLLFRSVADPDPNPDPHFFEPPGSGSGSISQRDGSGSESGSLYYQAKKVRKTLIPTAL